MARRNEEVPVVTRDHQFEQRIEDAVLTGVCHEAAWIFTHRNDCAVCLMIGQDTIPGNGRHALLRMGAEEARTLAHALLDAAPDPQLALPTPDCNGTSQESGEAG